MNDLKEIQTESQKGSALLEAVIALAAVIMAVAGIAIVIASSASNATFIQNQNQANKFAQEGIEFIKSIKDESYTNFLNMFQIGTIYCYGESFEPVIDNNNCIGDGNRLDNGKFIRKVTVSNSIADRCGNSDPENVRIIKVEVSWQSGKCDVSSNPFCHSSVLESCFIRPPQSTL